MRYRIYYDRIINQLVPHYFGGRNIVLFLQAIMHPLQTLNDAFAEYAKEEMIEATMTSQVFRFEWYLNRKFSKYFLDSTHQITIGQQDVIGTPIYYQDAKENNDREDWVLYGDKEVDTNGNPLTEVILRGGTERVGNNTISFVVNSPAVDTSKISQEEYEAMLVKVIEKYRIANKTYEILYESTTNQN